MSGTIKVGTIMMKVGTIIPQSFRVETEPYSHDWEIIKNSDANTVDRDIRRADWNFFFLAANMQATALGCWGENHTESNRASAGESETSLGECRPRRRGRVGECFWPCAGIKDLMGQMWTIAILLHGSVARFVSRRNPGRSQAGAWPHPT